MSWYVQVQSKRWHSQLVHKACVGGMFATKRTGTRRDHGLMNKCDGGGVLYSAHVYAGRLCLLKVHAGCMQQWELGMSDSADADYAHNICKLLSMYRTSYSVR